MCALALHAYALQEGTILSSQRQVRMEFYYTLSTIRVTKKLSFFLKHFIATLSLDVVHFTLMKENLLSATFSYILGLFNLVL